MSRLTPQSDVDQCRWLPCNNVSGADVPPFGVVRLLQFNQDGTYDVDYPSEDSQTFGLAFNGPTTLAIAGQGFVTTDLPFWAAYDDSPTTGSGIVSDYMTDGTPSAGEVWGTQTDSFYLHETQTGFRVLGVLADDPYADAGILRVMVVLDPFALDDTTQAAGSTDVYGDAAYGDATTCESSGTSKAGGSITIPFNACDDNGNPCQKDLIITSPVPLSWCINDKNDCTNPS